MNSRGKPLLVIINGPAGAGKSTLAVVLSSRLHLPLLDKDTIKEAIADVLGADDRAASYNLGTASFAVMRSLASRYLDLGIGAVLEAPFYGQEAQELRPLTTTARAVVLQCNASRKTLYNRVRNRAAARHWVHFDSPRGADRETHETWSSPDLAAAQAPPIDVPVLNVDTEDGYKPSLEEVVAWVRQHAGL